MLKILIISIFVTSCIVKVTSIVCYSQICVDRRTPVWIDEIVNNSCGHPVNEEVCDSGVTSCTTVIATHRIRRECGPPGKCLNNEESICCYSSYCNNSPDIKLNTWLKWIIFIVYNFLPFHT